MTRTTARKRSGATMPPIPRRAYSPLGVVPVTLIDNLTALLDDVPKDAQVSGRFRWATREIEVEREMPHAAQWYVYWHEVMHLALADSGVGNLLSHDLTEAVCDALAVYLTGAVRDGYLRAS